MKPTIKKNFAVVVECSVLADGTSLLCVRDPQGRLVHYFNDLNMLVDLFSELSVVNEQKED